MSGRGGTDPAPEGVGPLLSLPEAATLLGVCTLTLRRLQARGELPHVRIGRRVLMRESDIRAFLEAHAVGPGGGER